MKTREGKFAITVSESDKWLNFADLSEDDAEGTILKGVIEEAKEYSNKHREWTVIYIATKEIEIHPREQ
jgi:hypothetical protein